MAASDHPLSDYEKYIRTDELLRLQKPREELFCHDELQFQVVHQAAELWMKLVDHEMTFAAEQMRIDDAPRAIRLLQRVRVLMQMITDELKLLDTMAPRDYMTIRNALGRGSGQESPGFKRMVQLPDEVWPSFAGLLERRGVALRDIYEYPDRYPELFLLAEAMVDFDQSLQSWRVRHLTLVYRQIGDGTPSLKGKPSDLLAEGLKHRFFPQLWKVRADLFEKWSQANPNGSSYRL